MLVYEYLVEKLKHPTTAIEHHKQLNVNPMHIAIAGAVAGMTSWIPAIPFDVVKTRMMTEADPKRFRSLWHCFGLLLRVFSVKYN